MYYRNYDALFTMAFQSQLLVITNDYAQGIDIAQVFPQVGMISGMLLNTTVTPFQEDGYLYAGFTFLTDAETHNYDLFNSAQLLAYQNKEAIKGYFTSLMM